MDPANRTQHTEFTLLGLTDEPNLKRPLFAMFTFMYVFTVMGNIGIIALIQLTPRLQTPMYFFLGHLAFVDLGYSSDVAPKMLVDLLSSTKKISVIGCILQVLFFHGYGSMEVFLLGVMAYDRYVAICQPLHYMTIMTRRLCVQLITAVYAGGVIHTMIQTGNTFRQSFCRWEINHFCCDIPPLLKLSCTDTFSNVMILTIYGSFIVFIPFMCIIISYAFIISTILRMRSAAARLRIFSTCAPHFTGVTLYFGTIMYTYLRPSSSYSLEQDKVVTLCYSVVIPMLNPLIYSLRNKDVKEGLWKILLRNTFPNRILPQHT